MSFYEIMKELGEDMVDVFAISDKKEPKVKRLIQKSAIFPFRIHSFVTSRNKNRWLLMWEALSKKSIGDDCLFTYACIVNTSRGRYVIMPAMFNGEPIPLIFIPHFFQRYATRMGIELTGEDLIREYLQHNSNFSIDSHVERIDETKRALAITATSADGVALGYRAKDGEAFLLKTFITYDMAKGEQVDAFSEIEGRRKEHYDRFLNDYLSNI